MFYGLPRKPIKTFKLFKTTSYFTASKLYPFHSKKITLSSSICFKYIVETVYDDVAAPPKTQQCVPLMFHYYYLLGKFTLYAHPDAAIFVVHNMCQKQLTRYHGYICEILH